MRAIRLGSEITTVQSGPNAQRPSIVDEPLRGLHQTPCIALRVILQGVQVAPRRRFGRSFEAFRTLLGGVPGAPSKSFGALRMRLGRS